MLQTLALKNSGSLINFMYANNNVLPEVGKGATMLFWSDRHAYEVMEVSADFKRVVLKRYQNNNVKGLAYGDQRYMYEPQYLSEYETVLVWRNNAWKIEGSEVRFLKTYDTQLCRHGNVDHDEIFPNDCTFPVVVAGKTKLHKVYSKVNIIFGRRDEHYDFTF